MRLSIKQKQVLGVTAMVAIIVISLSVLHLRNLARVLLLESRDRVELLANAVYIQAAQVVTDVHTPARACCVTVPPKPRSAGVAPKTTPLGWVAVLRAFMTTASLNQPKLRPFGLTT